MSIMDKLLDPAGYEALWIGACAHQLQRHWRTVDPDELAQVALTLAHDPTLRRLSPQAAVSEWLRPVAHDPVSPPWADVQPVRHA